MPQYPSKTDRKQLADKFAKRERVLKRVETGDSVRLKDDSLMRVEGVENECLHGIILGHGGAAVPPENVSRINGKFV